MTQPSIEAVGEYISYHIIEALRKHQDFLNKEGSEHLPEDFKPDDYCGGRFSVNSWAEAVEFMIMGFEAQLLYTGVLSEKEEEEYIYNRCGDCGDQDECPDFSAGQFEIIERGMELFHRWFTSIK